MEVREYETLYAYEDSYWWYRGLRGILMEALTRLGLTGRSRILDAGCGTGRTVQALQQEMLTQGFGFDRSPHAAAYWPRRGLTRVWRASATEIPVRDGAFDAALCIDVLETLPGDGDERAYRELWRVVRPGGHLVLVVPAYPWLMDPQHHRAVHAVRRYTKAALVRLLRAVPVHLVRVTHLFPTVLPLVAARRLAQRVRPGAGGTPPRSDLRPLPGPVNRLLTRVVDWERGWLSRGDLPFGSSLLAIVQKPGTDDSLR